MLKVPQSWISRYSFALAATAAAIIVRALMSPVLGSGAPYILFFPFITLSAWYGGFGPGIFATIIGSAAAVYLYVDPLNPAQRITVRDGVLLALFLIGNAVISWICGALRAAHLSEHELATSRKVALENVKAAGLALKDSEIQFRSLFEGALDAVVIADDQGRYLDANPAACALMACPKEELIGRSVHDFVDSSLRTEVDKQWNAFRAEGELHGIIELIRADGNKIEVEFSAKASFLPGRHLSVMRDVTERQNAELERAKLLAQETRARQVAEESSRLKDEFLATISHELRTPLTAMLGWTQLLEGGSLNKDVASRAISAIDRNARSQAKLIDDLLDVSRIITGKLRMSVEGVDMAGLLESSIGAIGPAAEAKEIQINLTTPPGVFLVSGDPVRLQQVIWNLLTNAIKFTPRRGRIDVSLDSRDSNVTATVTDNGAGIEPEFLPFVFDRFRQADGSTTRNYGGLGLGLSIVRHLVDLHGGTTSAFSDGIGRGSTFVVSFPERGVDARLSKYAPSARNDSARNENSLIRLDGKRVLLVDDDPDTVAVIRILLEDRGAAVRTASSGFIALKEFEDYVPDVLVCDIGMPEMDGYEVIRRIRSLSPENGGRIPALALTAYARSEDRKHALTSGFQKHLSKPAEAPDLIAAVAELINDARFERSVNN